MVRHVIKWTFVALLVIGICCGGDIAVTKTSVSQNGVIGNIQGAEAGSSHVLGAVQVVGSSAPVAPATVASATVATVAAPLPVSPSSPSTTGNTLISAPSKTTIPTQQIQPVHPNEKPTTEPTKQPQQSISPAESITSTTTPKIPRPLSKITNDYEEIEQSVNEFEHIIHMLATYLNDEARVDELVKVYYYMEMTITSITELLEETKEGMTDLHKKIITLNTNFTKIRQNLKDSLGADWRPYAIPEMKEDADKIEIETYLDVMMQDISDQFERVLTMLDIPRQHKFSKEETKVMVSYVEEVMDMAEENFEKCKGLDKDGEFKEQIDSAEENEENIKYMLNEMSLPFYVPEWVSEKEKEEEEIKERKEKKEGESEEKKSEKEKEEHVKEEKSSEEEKWYKVGKEGRKHHKKHHHKEEEKEEEEKEKEEKEKEEKHKEEKEEKHKEEKETKKEKEHEEEKEKEAEKEKEEKAAEKKKEEEEKNKSVVTPTPAPATPTPAITAESTPTDYNTKPKNLTSEPAPATTILSVSSAPSAQSTNPKL